MVRDKLRGLDLNLLITLDSVLRHRSVTRAADHLEVSQGAVSQALGRLRAFFGDPLLLKTSHAMEPTPLGEELGAAIGEILVLVHGTVLSRAAFDPAGLTGPIRLSLTDMGEFTILPALLDRLSRVAPNCEVRTRSISEVEFKSVMESGQIDLAIGGPMGDVSDLMQQKLYEHELVALVSRNSPLESVLSVHDYASAGHIMIDSPNVKRVYVDRALARLGVARRVVLRTPNALIQPLLLESRPDLIVTAPRLLAEHYARFMGVKVLELGFQLPTISVYQYWHRRYDGHQLCRWLREIVHEITRETMHRAQHH